MSWIWHHTQLCSDYGCLCHMISGVCTHHFGQRACVLDLISVLVEQSISQRNDNLATLMACCLVVRVFQCLQFLIQDSQDRTRHLVKTAVKPLTRLLVSS